MIYLIIVLMATINPSSSRCEPNRQITDLWSDTATFALAKIDNNTMAYSFQSYTVPTPRAYNSSSSIQFAFCIKDFSVSTSTLMYFDLLVIKTFQSSLVLNFIYQPNKWQKITYNYWISFRKDMIMLIETYTDKQFTNSKQVYEVSSSIDLTQHNNKNKLVVMVFLVGIRYQRHQEQKNHRLSFALTQQKVQEANVKVQFQSKSLIPVEAVSLSFVVYQPSETGFGSYGGNIVKNNFSGTTTSNMYYLFPNHHFYALYGLSAIQACNKIEDSITYRSNLSPFYDFSISVQKWEQLNYLEVSYIISGNMPSAICQKVKQCQNEGNLFIHRNQCVSSCPNSSRPVNYIDGAVECQQCPENQQFNPIDEKCKCKDGFTLSDTNQCEKIIIPIVPAVTNSRRSAEDTLEGPTSSLADNCLTLNNIQQGNKNIFVTLKASPSVIGDKRSSDSGFVRISFSDGTGASSYYCNKCLQDNMIYECLILFANGVPSTLFTMNFECLISTGRQTQSKCSLSVPYKSIRPRL